MVIPEPNAVRSGRFKSERALLGPRSLLHSPHRRRVEGLPRAGDVAPPVEETAVGYAHVLELDERRLEAEVEKRVLAVQGHETEVVERHLEASQARAPLRNRTSTLTR